MWVTSISGGSESGSTAKPWFCEVMEILPLRRSLTGWLPPRWPNFSLKVLPPKAWARIWLPRQMPKIGFLPMQLAEFLVDVAERGRIAGAVGEEDAVRVFREHLGGGGGGVDHLDLEAGLAQAAQDVELDAEIVGDDPVADRRKLLVGARVAGEHVGQHPLAGFVLPVVGLRGVETSFT